MEVINYRLSHDPLTVSIRTRMFLVAQTICDLFVIRGTLLDSITDLTWY